MTGKRRSENIWLNGIMGGVIGDALGCPVQFMNREEVRKNPVLGMQGYGTYNMPPGTWTDDSSLTLATFVSMCEYGEIDPDDIMQHFVMWLRDGKYTPFGESFDIGNTTLLAIESYILNGDVDICGRKLAHQNGNGSLMRIMPVCLYCYRFSCWGILTDEEAIYRIHCVSGLTHDHMRSKIACGLYYFIIKAILDCEGDLLSRMQEGLGQGFEFYEKHSECSEDLCFYERLRNLVVFSKLPESDIKSTGYVVDSLEASIWCLCNTGTFKDALLKAVNLGGDTDTIGAIAGGLAGLYYGYNSIPEEWLSAIQRREWIESLFM